MILTAGARHPRSNNPCCERALEQLQGQEVQLNHMFHTQQEAYKRAVKFKVNYLESIENSSMKQRISSYEPSLLTIKV